MVTNCFEPTPEPLLRIAQHHVSEALHYRHLASTSCGLNFQRWFCHVAYFHERRAAAHARGNLDLLAAVAALFGCRAPGGKVVDKWN